MTAHRQPAIVCVMVLTLAAAACERESRPIDKLSSVASPPSETASFTAGPSSRPAPSASPFQANAWGMAEGKRLFTAFNCVGCHANGGGGMGPALMDDEWIYGSQPENIFASIVEGRPNGMPAWRGRIPDAQVWQLVAYVQSMSGQAPMTARPSRSDHLRAASPENARDTATPVQTGKP